VRSVPFDEDTSVWRYNPLGKVPCLIMNDGQPLFGGLVICEYLDSIGLAGRPLYPAGAARWAALRQAALGEGMFDATTLIRVESWRPREQWHLDYMLRERRKIMNALDRMELEAPDFRGATFHIGHVCMAGGLSYLELRNPIRDCALETGDAEFEWRDGRPNLAAWFEEVLMRPSVQHRVSLA
jgi:glutathione S-transferase